MDKHSQPLRHRDSCIQNCSSWLMKSCSTSS